MPNAGIPWYAVPFGRDSIITAVQTLSYNPSLAEGTLRVLAHHQGHDVVERTNRARSFMSFVAASWPTYVRFRTLPITVPWTPRRCSSCCSWRP